MVGCVSAPAVAYTLPPQFCEKTLSVADCAKEIQIQILTVAQKITNKNMKSPLRRDRDLE